MNYEQETDMKAAKLLGLHPQLVDTTWTENGKIKYGKAAFTEDGEFSLSDPATRDAVVQVLGEKYYISINAARDINGVPCWFWDNGITDAYYGEFEGYEEAVRAAVNSVEVKDD